MGTLLVQAIHDHDSGLPEDAVVNTFHFLTSNELSGTLTDVAEAVEAFYDDVQASGSALGTFLSPELATTGRIKMYDLDEPKPRVPIFDEAVTWTTAGVTTALPAQVAFVLSFQADPQSGKAQARRRNRIFLGPLSNAAADSTTGVTRRPSSTLINTAIDAMEVLYAFSAGHADIAWVTYSPTSSSDDRIHNVTSGWVDNRFDTQRRRLNRPTARTTWAA